MALLMSLPHRSTSQQSILVPLGKCKGSEYHPVGEFEVLDLQSLNMEFSKVLQGVQQNCIHFCFVNFSTSKGFRHFSTALTVQILKTSILLSFGEILTKLFLKYLKEVISKVNIFCLLLNQELKHSGSLGSIQECP